MELLPQFLSGSDRLRRWAILRSEPVKLPPFLQCREQGTRGYAPSSSGVVGQFRWHKVQKLHLLCSQGIQRTSKAMSLQDCSVVVVPMECDDAYSHETVWGIEADQ